MAIPQLHFLVPRLEFSPGIEFDRGSASRKSCNNSSKRSLKAASFDKRICDRLRGRMVFFGGILFGRVFSRAILTVSKACKGSGEKVLISPEVRRALRWLSVRIADSTSLVVEPSCAESWPVFTDGACAPENSWGGIGGVLVSPQGRVVEFFGDSIPEKLTHALLARSANPIFELELAPLYLALSI